MIIMAGVFGLFVLTYFGAFIPSIAAWQPLRFKVALDLFLVIGAAYCIDQWLSGANAFPFRLVPVLISLSTLGFTINVWQTELSGKLRSRSEMGCP
jgi:hypothetical protein